MEEESIQENIHGKFLLDLENLENEFSSDSEINEEKQDTIKKSKTENFIFENIKLIKNNITEKSTYKQIEISLKEIKIREEEIKIKYQKTSTIYNKVFPELKSLILEKISYIRTILLLNNFENFHTKNFDFIPKNLLITLFMTADQKNTSSLSENEKANLFKNCQNILKLENEKKIIFNYLEKRVYLIAPNTVEVAGTEITAKLLTKIGGIKEMAQTPSCNIQVIGGQKRALLGKSKNKENLHIGFFGIHPLFLKSENFCRKKVVRLLANCVAKTSRIDSVGLAKDGKIGKKFYLKILEDIRKFKLPRKDERKKPLKAPGEKKKSRRGGKRLRKMKGRLEITEIRKMKNRLKFGTDFSEPILNEVEDLGMLTQKNYRKLKIRKNKNQKINLNKKQKKRQNHNVNVSNLDGIKSNLIFTSSKAIELINPNLNNHKKGEKSIFDNLGFKSIIKNN